MLGEEGAEGEAAGEQRAIMEAYFVEQVAEHLEPVILRQEDTPPFLKDHTSYLVAELQPGPVIGTGTAGPELGIGEVPSPPLSRSLS
ncbi:MAG: hypothetical protein IH796_12470, partial [Deltaproteobacteria bacterium]|nr:hypothetical protein [Deltaproteobacteria bacterium]